MLYRETWHGDGKFTRYHRQLLPPSCCRRENIRLSDPPSAGGPCIGKQPPKTDRRRDGDRRIELRFQGCRTCSWKFPHEYTNGNGLLYPAFAVGDEETTQATSAQPPPLRAVQYRLLSNDHASRGKERAQNGQRAVCLSTQPITANPHRQTVYAHPFISSIATRANLRSSRGGYTSQPMCVCFLPNRPKKRTISGKVMIFATLSGTPTCSTYNKNSAETTSARSAFWTSRACTVVAYCRDLSKG